ncbi:MAG: hypothetical protein ACLUEQ_10440 [Cloacibacillus evryensis]
MPGRHDSPKWWRTRSWAAGESVDLSKELLDGGRSQMEEDTLYRPALHYATVVAARIMETLGWFDTHRGSPRVPLPNISIDETPFVFVPSRERRRTRTRRVSRRSTARAL